jgi:hypothetical protein
VEENASAEPMGYGIQRSIIADPDVFMRKASKWNGFEYYENMLTYVDDCLCVSHRPEDPMDVIGKIYDLKDTVKPPERYLGASIKKWQLPDGREVWSMSGKDYVKNAVKICKEMLLTDGKTLRSGRNAERPMARTYWPEMDISQVLEPELASRYQQLIGILRWAVKLGRVDILVEVSMMSSHLCQPRLGHLEEVYNIFAYLEKHGEANMAFDDKMPFLDGSAFHKSDWSESILWGSRRGNPANCAKTVGNPCDNDMLCGREPRG